MPTLFMLVACQLPNVGGFADGVVAVHEGVDRSGVIYAEAAASVYADPSHGTVKAFRKGWKKRREATAALVRYADSLVATVDASTEASQNVEAFGAAVNDLGSSLGATQLAGSEVFAVGGALYKLGSTFGALKTLSEAVQAAHPAIDQACNQVLIPDLEAMAATLDAIEQKQIADLETTELEDNEGSLAKLSLRRKGLEAALADEWSAEAAQELEQMNAVIPALQVRVTAVHESVADVERQFRAHRELLVRTVDALHELVIVHFELRAALREGSNVNARTLLAAAGQIQATIEDIQQIREEQ